MEKRAAHKNLNFVQKKTTNFLSSVRQVHDYKTRVRVANIELYDFNMLVGKKAF